MTDTNFALMVDEIHAIVGDRGLLSGEDMTMRSCDPFHHVSPQGRLIIRPANTSEVARVLASCAKHSQRVVTHGGRTGVAGGAYVGSDEIVLSLERMADIISIDAENGVAIVEAGAKLQAVQEAAEALGLFYPVDLGAKGSATIGGTLATNAGGNRVIRWGMTRQNVLGLEAVLSDGTVVDAMNRLLKNNTGYDVKQFFIGSEGTLGVITRAALRLYPKPKTQAVAFAAVSEFSKIRKLLSKSRALPTLSAFEVMWKDYYEKVAGSGTNRNPLAANEPYYLLLETMGYNDDLDSSMFEVFLQEAYEEGLVSDAVTASSNKQIGALWHVREGSEVLVQCMAPFIPFDVSVDISRAEHFVHKVYEVLGSNFPVLQTCTLGHLGDNNLHLGVHVGPRTSDLALEIERQVYDVVREFEGALTAEHGIGQFKKNFLPAHVSSGAMQVMQRARSAFDPLDLLNQNVLF